jgi:hypothetical protein
MNTYLKLIIISATAYFTAASCAVSYKFNNAQLDYSIYKTLSLSDFPNQAALVYPPLYQQFNEALKDAFTRQTRLQIVSQNGDYDIQGAIVGYYLQQSGVAQDNFAAQTKLTISVRVQFTNSKNSAEDFEKTFSASEDFSSSIAFESVQSELCANLIKQIVDDIFNSTVANW